MQRLLLTIPLGAAIVALTGCGACRTSNYVAQQPYSCNRCLDNIQPPPIGGVSPPPSSRQYAAVPAPPPSSRTLPPGPSVESGSATFVPPSTDATPPPPPSAIERSSFDTIPAPARPDPLFGSPPVSPPTSSPEAAVPSVKLGPPSPIHRAEAREPSDSTKEPPIARVPNDTEMPQAIDLPGFAIAITGVANGIKPFPDGINWLAERGYKAALHLRGSNENNVASRRMFEKKGLKYLTLELDAYSLTKEVYESFVKQVNATENHPLFVFDRDGSLAGALWYLYFRVEKQESDEKARAEAQRLGLRFDDEEHRPMVLAAQRLLAELR